MIGCRGLVARLTGWLRGPVTPTVTIDDPGLRVVAGTGDAAESASTTLGRATGLDQALPAVLRHRIAVPAPYRNATSELLERDGWHVRTDPFGAEPGQPDRGGDETAEVTVIALRVQRLTAVDCARETSRMVGLAQRFGGSALGWDALQPRPPT